MAQQTFSVPANARIVVRQCTERVTITGWEHADQVITDCPARQEGDTIIVENVRRATLRAPVTVSVNVQDCEADVRIETISGNVELQHIEGDLVLRGLAQATLRDIEGDISARGVATIKGEGTWEGDAALRGVADTIDVNEIEGDAALNDVGAVTIQNLEGDLVVRVMRGPLHLGDADGDVSLHDIAGDITVARLDGDFIAAGVQGSIDAPEIDGDAVVSLADVKGVVVRAKGDTVINLPVNANCDIELDAPHGDVIARGLHVEERDKNHVRGKLGSGGPKVVVESLHDDVIARFGAEGPGARHPGAEMGEEFGRMGREMGEMGREMGALGRELGEEIRRSVHESLARSGIHNRGPYPSREEMDRIREEVGRFRDEQRQAREERVRARDERQRARDEQQRQRDDQARARHEQEQPVSEEPVATEAVNEAEMPVAEPKPSGPPAGSPERKAILDAIARGEISVDDAIRKLNGE